MVRGAVVVEELLCDKHHGFLDVHSPSWCTACE